jgi:hypothetical protein
MRQAFSLCGARSLVLLRPHERAPSSFSSFERAESRKDHRPTDAAVAVNVSHPKPDTASMPKPRTASVPSSYHAFVPAIACAAPSIAHKRAVYIPYLRRLPHLRPVSPILTHTIVLRSYPVSGSIPKRISGTAFDVNSPTLTRAISPTRSLHAAKSPICWHQISGASVTALVTARRSADTASRPLNIRVGLCVCRRTQHTAI